MSVLVNAQATIYPDLVSIYIPDEPILKGYSSSANRHTKIDFVDKEIYFENESPIERSIRRTKKQIRDYILCNHFEIFATFTFRDNRYDTSEKRKQMSSWFKNQQKRNGSFKYLAVPELHTDGATHFHVLLTDYTGKIEEAINPKTGRHISKYGQTVYFFPEYTLGFSNFRLISQSIEDRIKIATYISKYITKDMPIFKDKKRYFCSQGLLLPILIDNPSTWYQNVEPSWQKKTKNGTVLRFVRGSSDIVDKVLEESKWTN